MIRGVKKTTLALNMLLVAALIYLLYSSWKKSNRRVRISPIVQAIPQPMVVTRDGEPLYVERHHGDNLQMVAAMHSSANQ
jgi:hypothetical protein